MPTLYVNSDNVVEVQNLKDIVNDTILTSATVTVTLKDKAGIAPSGATFPLSMPHVSGGLYRATLPDTLVLNTRKKYIATYVADAGAGLHREWCVEYDVTCADS